jgi:hypothetical protein
MFIYTRLSRYAELENIVVVRFGVRTHVLLMGNWYKTEAHVWSSDIRCVVMRGELAWDQRDHPFVEADQIDCMVYITRLPPAHGADESVRLVVFDKFANFYLD